MPVRNKETTEGTSSIVDEYGGSGFEREGKKGGRIKLRLQINQLNSGSSGIGTHKNYFAAEGEILFLNVGNYLWLCQCQRTGDTGLQETLVDDICASEGSDSSEALGLERNRPEVSCGVCQRNDCTVPRPNTNGSTDRVYRLRLCVSIGTRHFKTKVPEVELGVGDPCALTVVQVNGLIVVANIGNGSVV